MVERNKALEERLNELIKRWSQDSNTLVRHQTLSKGNAKKILNELIEEGYDVVDLLVREYEREAKENRGLERKYPRQRVYSAAKECCEAINTRWDEIFQQAKNNGYLDPNQIAMVEIANRKV